MVRGFDTDTVVTRSVIQEAKANGFSSAGRYIKNLSLKELSDFKAEAFGLWLIDEAMGDWAYFSGAGDAGTRHGLSAKNKAIALGYPAGQWIATAIDFDATASHRPIIAEHNEAYALAVAPYKLLVYGSGAVLRECLPDGAKGYLACSGGWAGTSNYDKSKAAIVQHLPAQMLGIDVDLCDINDDSVIWYPSGAQPAPTKPQLNMPPLSQLQAILGVTADGIWGQNTASAMAAYYRAHRG